MSNISFFFPKRQQGLALGLNAGLGNAGVTTMQILVPLVMTFGLFGGEPMILENTSGTLIGKIPAGSETYLQNAGYVWLLLLIPLAFAGRAPHDRNGAGIQLLEFSCHGEGRDRLDEERREPDNI